MRDESCSQKKILERMALKTHPEGLKGMYEDNFSWIAGTKVEIKKSKRILG